MESLIVGRNGVRWQRDKIDNLVQILSFRFVAIKGIKLDNIRLVLIVRSPVVIRSVSRAIRIQQNWTTKN